MKFCINIENTLKTICYRLQNDNSWKTCNNPREVLQDDFATTVREEVLELQIPDKKMIIDDKEYIVNSSDGVDFFDMADLHYVVYGFRSEYPNLPNIEQLKIVFLNGDDSENNTLILKTDGLFYFIAPTEIVFPKVDPNIIYQYEAFIAGNGYVGEAINDEEFKEYILGYFKTGMHYWRNHLTKKEMHEQSDTDEITTIDELLDIYDDLDKIKW